LQDLLDYLVQLLGADRHQQLLNFVGNVERFQNGTELQDESVEIDEKGEDALSIAKKPALVTLTTKTPKQQSQAKKEISVSKTSSSGAPKSASAAAAAPKEIDPAPKQLSNRNKKKAALEHLEAAKPPEPRKPSQGKASIECGCFGSLHQALTNCLHCGRISCAKEGYDYCPFCGFLVEEVIDMGGSGENVEYVGLVPSSPTCRDFSSCVHSSGALTCRLTLGNRKDDAWIHKESLLRYDREVAQRTVVIDDQADYYSNATSVWLTENERNEAAAQEKQRQEDIHLRKKMQLNLAL
jgi:Putative zinc finger motif, C2HC5-type